MSPGVQAWYGLQGLAPTVCEVFIGSICCCVVLLSSFPNMRESCIVSCGWLCPVSLTGEELFLVCGCGIS